MAGDWLKMRHDLADDPAVIRMAAVCGLDEDAVVGKLHRLWSWADRHTADGHADGIGLSWVDRTARCEGFGAAMVSVGWLEETGSGLAFPRFDRHCGDSAKARALKKNRMERSRSDSVALRAPQNGESCGAASATKAPPEKRREEKREREDNTRAGGGEPPVAGPEAADPEPLPAIRSRAGWVHDEWARIVAAWNATERAVPWTLLTPPNGFADLAAAPGWVESAMAAIGLLPACQRFTRPVPWTQFVRDLDRILAGEFRDPAEPRRELAVVGGGAGGRPQRRGNMR